jgi:hypothetical protein
MNKYILIAIAILVFAGGGFLLSQKRSTASKGKNVEEMNDRPTAQGDRSYQMEVTSSTENINPNQPINITYKIKNDLGNTLSKFEVAHEKSMHFISIRKDLQYFQHLHPEYDSKANEFSVNLSFPDDGPYRIFADFVPGEDNPKKLPVAVYKDISAGKGFKEIPLEVDQSNKKTNGYEITYVFPDEMELKKQKEFTYSLVIERAGKTVNGLENYLGSKGHSVIIKQGTLDYIHTHAGKADDLSMEGMDHSQMSHATPSAERASNRIDFSTSFPEAGVYKIFTQFQHDGKVITSDYVIKVG